MMWSVLPEAGGVGVWWPGVCVAVGVMVGAVGAVFVYALAIANGLGGQDDE